MVKKTPGSSSNWFKIFRHQIQGLKQIEISKVYIIALSSIAVLAIVFQGLKTSGHSEQLKTAQAIRTLERHFANIENLKSSVVDLQITTNHQTLQNKIQRTKRKIATLNRKNQELSNLLDSDICQKVKCARYKGKDVFTTLNEKITPDQPIEVQTLEALMTGLENYEIFISEVSQIYEDKVKTTTQQLIFWDFLFLFSLFTVLILQGVFGFRPAVRRLNEALSVRSDFISRISHEIRNPMNSIMGMADILKSTRLSPEQEQYVDTLQRSSEVLLEMLNNLVDFSGVENKAIQLKPARFDLYKLVDKVIDVISVPAHDKGLEVYVDVDPAIPAKLNADFIRIEQVLLNLCNNALKFTNKGHILFKARQIAQSEESVRVEFTVQDTGIGIARDKKEEIFKSFVQEDSSIKRKYGGSGLGLSICKEIVELMNSSIDLESEKNVGSTFSFILDLDIAESKEVTTPRKRERLVYMTNQKDLKPIEDYLSSIATNPIVFNQPEQIKEYMTRSQFPKKIVVDDSIGIINMINIMNSVQSMSPKTQVFALMRSNFPKENIELIRKNGYRYFLIKPFREWHLLSTNQNMIKWNKDQEEKERFIRLENKMRNKKVQILAVDDANDNLFLIKEILSSVTNHIDFAKNGLEACEQCETKTYDLIFMDIQMPIMDGYTAIRKLRSLGIKTPVFAVTAHAGLVEENKCIEAGFNGRITKPINRTKIVQVIEKALKFEGTSSYFENDNLEKKMIQKLLPTYFQARQEDIVILKSALKEQNFETMKRIGHRIKGSAKSYGFEEIGRLGHELEDVAGQGDLAKSAHYIDQILAHISREQQKFLSQPTPPA